MYYQLDSRHKTSTEHDSLSIFEFDFACMGKVVTPDSMESVILRNMESSLKVYGAEPLPGPGVPQRYELNGYAAEFVEDSVEAPSVRKGMILYSGSTCVLMRQTVVCWSIVSADKRKLHELLANPVVFDGKPETALVPKNMLN